MPPPEPPEPLVLAGGLALVEGEVRPATLFLAEGRIRSVGGEDRCGDAPRVDCRGLTLVPGFVDAHVHLHLSDPEAVLAGGVTTVRDLGGPPGAARRGMNHAGSDLRVLSAGRILTPVGGYPSRSWGADGSAREVDGPDDARQAVAEQVAAGACVIKVALEDSHDRPLFEPDALHAIVGEARMAGLAVTAHVGSAKALRLALEVEVAELAHLPFHDVTPAAMERAAFAGVVLVPTLAVRERVPDEGALRAVAAFRAAGGRVIYGSDLGNDGTLPGVSTAEVLALGAAGLRPAEVLDAMTGDAADHLGIADIGRLTPGTAADVVGVRGDPLTDLRALTRVRLVIAAGRLVVPPTG